MHRGNPRVAPSKTNSQTDVFLAGPEAPFAFNDSIAVANYNHLCLILFLDPVLALSQLSYTFAEVTEETGEICVVLEGPSGGLATGTLEVLFTIDTGNINRPAS